MALYAFAVYKAMSLQKLTYEYVVIATKPVHRVQIRPIVHNWRAPAPLPFPKLHLGPCSSVGMWRGTHRQTDGRDQYTFRLGTPHAKCNNKLAKKFDIRPHRRRTWTSVVFARWRQCAPDIQKAKNGYYGNFLKTSKSAMSSSDSLTLKTHA